MLEKGGEVVPAYESSKASVLSKEFGAELKPHQIQSLILTSLMYDGYTKEEVKETLKIYKNLDLSALMQKPSRIRRVGVYIGYLTFMYVIPQMSSMFEAMEIPDPDIFTWFTGNWTTILIAVLAALIVALLVSTLRKILTFRPATVDGSPKSPISWLCGYDAPVAGMSAVGANKTTLSNEYLPAACRKR
jgi:hypothetical protein